MYLTKQPSLIRFMQSGGCQKEITSVVVKIIYKPRLSQGQNQENNGNKWKLVP